MRLSSLHILNNKSIVDPGDIRFKKLQAFVFIN